MIYYLVTPASVLPVSLADAKAHLRVTNSDQDNLITDIIWGAAREFENRTNEVLSEQTWDLVLNQSEVVTRIEFFKFPVKSITSVSYFDVDDSADTVSSDDYTLFITGRPSSIIFDSVPSTYLRDDSMTIRFVAGYTTLPLDIKQAVLAKVFRLYENPADPVSEKVSYFDRIVRDYRAYDL